MAVKASAIVTLMRVDDGKDAAIQSATAPSDKTKLWYDTTNNVFKRWDGSAWIVAYENEINDAKDAANNAQESANTAVSSVNDISTNFGAYKDEVRAEFTSTVEYVDGKTEVIDTWIRQGTEGNTPFLELGGTANELKARLKNSELGFYEGDEKLGYFGNKKMHAANADIDNANINRLQSGNYVRLNNSDGHLTLVYIG